MYIHSLDMATMPFMPDRLAGQFTFNLQAKVGRGMLPNSTCLLTEGDQKTQAEPWPNTLLLVPHYEPQNTRFGRLLRYVIEPMESDDIMCRCLLEEHYCGRVLPCCMNLNNLSSPVQLVHC